MNLLRFSANDTVSFQFTLLDTTGLPFNFSNQTVFFQIERNKNVFVVEPMTEVSAGVFRVVVPGTSSSKMLGLYIYRVVAQDSTTEQQRVLVMGEVEVLYAPPVDQEADLSDLSEGYNYYEPPPPPTIP